MANKDFDTYFNELAQKRETFTVSGKEFELPQSVTLAAAAFFQKLEGKNLLEVLSSEEIIAVLLGKEQGKELLALGLKEWQLDDIALHIINHFGTLLNTTKDTKTGVDTNPKKKSR